MSTRSGNYVHTIIGLLVAVTSFRATGAGQSMWTSRPPDNSAEIEFLHPLFKEGTQFTGGNIFTLSTRILVGGGNHIVVEVPIVSGTRSGSSLTSNSSEARLGNPYIGYEFGASESILFGEIGFRLPLMLEQSSTAALVGIAADFDRFEAYVPNLIQITSAVNLRGMSEGLGGWLRLAPSLDLSSTGRSTSDIYLAYSGFLLAELDPVSLAGGISGRMILTTESTSDRAVDQVELGARLRIGSIRPGIQLRLPLDEGLSQTLSYVYGLSVSADF